MSVTGGGDDDDDEVTTTEPPVAFATAAVVVSRESDGRCDPYQQRLRQQQQQQQQQQLLLQQRQLKQRQQQQQQQQQRRQQLLGTSTTSSPSVDGTTSGTTSDGAAGTGRSWTPDTIAGDGVTDRTPLLDRQVAFEDEDGGDGGGGVVGCCDVDGETAACVTVDELGENFNYGSIDEDLFMSNSPTMTGAFTRQPSTGSGKQLVFCIHGKPSGCCATLVTTEDNNSNREKPDLNDGKSSITIFNEHCHPNREITPNHKKARRKLIFASVLCLIFMVGESIGGYLSSSLAIATDASHLLTDFASFMISLCAIWVASRPATQSMPFGWYRAEVLGALTSVLLIWVVTGVLLYVAVDRLRHMAFEIDANIMVITSAVGLCVNLIMGLTLHQHSHSHSGLGSHSHETSDPSSTTNINVRAAYIHVLGDIIQSLGVLIAAVILYYKPEWKIVDPICTFFFSILVLITTFNIIRDTMVVLMEGMPKGVNFTDVQETFMSIDGVVRVHNLRVWALSPDKIALAAHLAVKPGVNTTTVLKEASRKMYMKYNFFDCTLQIEEFESQMENCVQCQPLKC